MPRAWDPAGRRWVTDYPPRQCRACGGDVARPLFYCELHAPARRAYLRTWQRANAEHIRRYQRARAIGGGE